MRQELVSHGVPAEHLYVDKTRQPYEDWRDAVQTGKGDYYPSDALFNNADSLIDTGKKIDHVARNVAKGSDGRGAKDVSDSMAAVVHVLVKQFGGEVGMGSIM